MIAGMLGNVALGSGIKIAAHVIGKVLDSRSKQKEMERAALHNMEIDKLKVMYGGPDTADNFTKATRRLLAFILVGVFCSVILYHVMWRPDLAYRILIPSEPGFFEGWFSATEKESTINVSAGALLWRYFELMEVVIGFYFTKIGGK